MAIPDTSVLDRMMVRPQNGRFMGPALPGSLAPPTMTPGGGGTGAPLQASPGMAPPPTPAPVSAPQPAAPMNALSPTDALNNFANSAGMQFAQQQMANGVNNLYAAHGALQSGAAAKEIQDRSGQIALQDYFFPYMNYLTGQQAMGAQAASAINGIGSSYGNTINGMGQNYSNAVTGINQNMGNALSQGALNIGNANSQQAAINGLANANFANTVGSSLGSVGSSFFAPKY